MVAVHTKPPRAVSRPSPAPAHPRHRTPGRWRRWLLAAAFLAPALAVLTVWIVYPTARTVLRSLFGRDPHEFVGLDNYHTLFTTDTLTTAIRNNALWVAVVPLTVTAIGTVLAVLTERIRWSAAFRTAIFMPMAVSMFAAGVIWHVMAEKDPQRGTLNAVVGAVHDAVSPTGVLANGRPSTPALTGDAGSGIALRDPVRPGQAAPLGLTGIPARDVPPGSVRAAIPPAAADQVTGTVFRDFSPGGGRPGVVEPGEAGIPGATVELRDAGGRVVATTRTAADGGFRFTGLAPGDYRLAIGPDTFAAPFAGVDWLGPKLITPTIMIAYVWMWAGFAMVLIAAGLSAIPREVLDAARVDGASEWQVFRRVTVPLLAPVLTVVLVTMVVNVLKVFDIVMAVASESTQDDANVIALAMWRTSFSGDGDYGLGSAISVVLFLLVLPALAFNIRRFRREGRR
ncbi:ABC transporter permease [Phytohabitans suffuscus]|uniref:ABC transporter permease n=1 Tax=Phytohabitans suffuscus TaxID=624315 RepID=A0A6F8Z0J3_9ACTN|nr:ABC transporter permease subunit [Phytohabitans suffuscus]BCB91950.1 ABC transporter permease [Phytohabitans suffuscus]